MLTRLIRLAAAALIAVSSIHFSFVSTAYGQIAENVPAGAFLPQIVADLDLLQRGIESGRLISSEPMLTSITIHWRDGITHQSRGGLCSLEDFVNDICVPSLPVTFDDLGDQSVVWDITNEEGVTEGQLWIGFFGDAEYVVENGDLVGFANEGAITGTPGGGYMMFGLIRANTVHWAMFGLASIVGEQLLEDPILEWDWQFLKTGLSVVSGTSHVVIADASTEEYALLLAIIAAGIARAAASLGCPITPPDPSDPIPKGCPPVEELQGLAEDACIPEYLNCPGPIEPN